MLLALIGCSACPEEIEVAVADLDEIDRLACECGYGFVVLAVSEVDADEPAAVTPLRPRRELREAA